MEWPGPPEKAEEPGPAAPCLSPGARRDSRPRSVPPPASQPCVGRGLNTPRESQGGSELGLFKSTAKVLLNKPPELGLMCSAPFQALAGSPGVGTGRGRGGWKQEQAAGVAPLSDAPPWRPAGELLVALMKEFESSRKALDPTLAYLGTDMALSPVAPHPCNRAMRSEVSGTCPHRWGTLSCRQRTFWLRTVQRTWQKNWISRKALLAAPPCPCRRGKEPGSQQTKAQSGADSAAPATEEP